MLAGFQSRNSFLPDARQFCQAFLTQTDRLMGANQIPSHRNSGVLHGGKVSVCIRFRQWRQRIIVRHRLPPHLEGNIGRSVATAARLITGRQRSKRIATNKRLFMA